MSTKKSSSAKPTSAAKAVAKASPAKKTGVRPSESEIAGSAYALWEREGRPNGRDVMHWFQAEAESH